ncbi:hypothetical protein GCM10010495_39520 [Kitasatospora herbaricolor]|nr:hypothetical protein GCM10010495_39520 [Kitasatospora herbaricolor]
MDQRRPVVAAALRLLGPGVSEQQALDGEQRQPGVVGDPPGHPLGVRDQPGDPGRTVLGPDRVQGQEPDGVAQRVPDGSAEQAAADAGAVDGQLVP